MSPFYSPFDVVTEDYPFLDYYYHAIRFISKYSSLPFLIFFFFVITNLLFHEFILSWIKSSFTESHESEEELWVSFITRDCIFCKLPSNNTMRKNLIGNLFCSWSKLRNFVLRIILNFENVISPELIIIRFMKNRAIPIAALKGIWCTKDFSIMSFMWHCLIFLIALLGIFLCFQFCLRQTLTISISLARTQKSLNLSYC